MKNRFVALLFVVPALALGHISAAVAAPKTMPVALRSMASKEGRHISLAGGGKLFLGSTVVGPKEVFNLIDLNGGALQNGDSVQLQFVSNKPTYWQEAGALINRTGDKPGAKCLFKVKWKTPNKTLQLRAPSGKFLVASQKGQDILTTTKATDPATVFAIETNPKIVQRPAAKKPGAAKPVAAKPVAAVKKAA